METIIAREWLELLDWPFNNSVGLQRTVAEFGKMRGRVIAALHDPRRALRKAHELFPCR